MNQTAHSRISIKGHFQLRVRPGALWLLVLLSAASAHAAGRCYTALPVEDENNTPLPIDPVCRVLEANLNQFCDEPPLMCGIKIAPKYARDLSFPKWKPIDLHGKIDLVEETVRARWNFAPNKSASQAVWDAERPPFDAGLAAGTLSLGSADFDLLGIGKKLTVYRIDPGTCEKDNRQVLQSRSAEAWNGGFLASNTKVLPAPSTVAELDQQYVIGDLGGNGDVVFYKNLPLHYWMGALRQINSSEKPTIELNVWKPLILQQKGRKPSVYRKEVCRIEYKATGGEK